MSNSPSSASLSSAPGEAGPTVPILTAPGRLQVPKPHVSDIPHSSASSIPRAWKNSITSTGVGAAPALTATIWSSPSIWRRFENRASSAAAHRASSSSGTGSPRWRSRTRSSDASIAAWIWARCSSGAFDCIASSPALSFSQIRGTAKNHVGRTWGRNETTSRGFGQQVIVPA
jgi:hypothetical protein